MADYDNDTMSVSEWVSMSMSVSVSMSVSMNMKYMSGTMNLSIMKEVFHQNPWGKQKFDCQSVRTKIIRKRVF